MLDVVKILREADDATLRTLLPKIIGVVEAAKSHVHADHRWSPLKASLQALATAAAAVEKEARGG